MAETATAGTAASIAPRCPAAPTPGVQKARTPTPASEAIADDVSIMRRCKRRWTLAMTEPNWRFSQVVATSVGETAAGLALIDMGVSDSANMHLSLIHI